jgi:hypothetical protein
LIHWVHAVSEIAKSRLPGTTNGTFLGRLIAGSVLNAGPWAFLAASYFAFYISSESWASSFFVGAMVWFTFLGAVTTYGMWRAHKLDRDRNATPTTGIVAAPVMAVVARVNITGRLATPPKR